MPGGMQKFLTNRNEPSIAVDKLVAKRKGMDGFTGDNSVELVSEK